MKKKITNEEIGLLIGKIAEQVREEMNQDLALATKEMREAEEMLVKTLNDEQKVLYSEYFKKRNNFCRIAGEMYQKIY